MKKYILLSLFSVVSCGLVIIFYSNSVNLLLKSHEATLKTLYQLHHTETSLEKDLLQARNYLIQSYDPIVKEVSTLRNLCGDLKSSFASEKSLSEKTKLYCDLIEIKISNVERFKSMNAILKNSLYYIHKVSSDFEFTSFSKSKVLLQDEFIMRQLLKYSLAYTAIPTAEAKSTLIKAIHDAKAGRQQLAISRILGSVILHSEKIIQNKQDLDTIIQEIMGEQTESDGSGNLALAYLSNYNDSQARANIFRNLLFASCVIFFLLIILGIRQIWQGANALLTANQNLEARVLERTSDLKKSQEIIIEQQHSLIASAKMSALGEMAGGVAHEINTPLAIISMRTEYLEECVADGTYTLKDVTETMRVIKKTTDRIAKIVSGLRFFSRDVSGAPFEDHSIVNIIDDTLSFCAERFSAHGVQIEFKDRNQVLNTVLSCRAVELSQVLLNLLNNSYDAVLSLQEKWIHIEIVQSSDYVEISIIDSGKGITQSVQDKIMQPFFTTKEVGKGTGLGLSVSRGIVASHFGKLFVDNNCANTKFTILLPRIHPLSARDVP